MTNHTRSGLEITREMRAEQSARTYSPSGVCQICSVWKDRLQLDHIDPAGLHDTSNLQWACEPCHYAKTAKENRVRHTINFNALSPAERRAKFSNRLTHAERIALVRRQVESGVQLGRRRKEVMPHGD